MKFCFLIGIDIYLVSLLSWVCLEHSTPWLRRSRREKPSSEPNWSMTLKGRLIICWRSITLKQGRLALHLPLERRCMGQRERTLVTELWTSPQLIRPERMTMQPSCNGTSRTSSTKQRLSRSLKIIRGLRTVIRSLRVVTFTFHSSIMNLCIRCLTRPA